MAGPYMASHRVPLPAFSHLTHISYFSFSVPSPRSPWSSSSCLLSPRFQVIWRSIAQILGRVRFTASFRLGIIGGLELMVSVNQEIEGQYLRTNGFEVEGQHSNNDGADSAERRMPRTILDPRRQFLQVPCVGRKVEAHTDYIRCVAVHPTLPYVLSSSDDMLIKLWDWEKGWVCTQIFEGHSHYVMQVTFNPKDTNTFASASLDRTIKIWNLGSPDPNFTLDAHQKGVNCVFTGGYKPYLITGSDDHTAKVQTLEGHTHNVSAVCFHPEFPIIITGSEDGTVRIWHSTTYSSSDLPILEGTYEKCWQICGMVLVKIEEST
ncbi:coatomer subunit beta'-2 [Fagus crenata]